MTELFFAVLVIAGGIAGLGAGFMGIGGGAVLTPICLIVYPLIGVDGGQLVKIIFGTNMLMVTVLSISSAMRHYRHGRVDVRTVLAIAPAAVLGSVLGSWAASHSDPLILKKAFALLLIASSALIVIKGSDKPEGHPDSPPVVSRLFLPVLGIGAGFLGSFLGIGGGIVMIPPLILLFALPVSVVAGTSSSIIIAIGITGAIGYMHTGGAAGLSLPGWSTGYVWWSAALPLMLGGVPMAALGARLNARTKAKTLQRVFGAVLLALALRILFT